MQHGGLNVGNIPPSKLKVCVNKSSWGKRQRNTDDKLMYIPNYHTQNYYADWYHLLNNSFKDVPV